MSSDSDPLHELLDSYGAEGRSDGVGSFSVNPERATEMLRDQGRLGQNAFLYLLSAIHAHVQGTPVERLRRGKIWTLKWRDTFGALPNSVELLVAEASFQAHGATLQRDVHGVTLQSTKLQDLYDSVAARLLHYPFLDCPPHADLDVLGRFDDVVLIPSRERGSRFVQIVHGVDYATRWGLPVDAICFDSQARPDLGLTTIPASDHKRALMVAAEQLFLRILTALVEPAKPYLLDPDCVPPDAPLFATYLSFAVSQREDLKLKALCAERVLFPDATGSSWTTAELLEIYARDKRMMIVDRRSESTKANRDRPVLLWTGQVKEVGRPLFTNLAHGAGYLYSMAVNAMERERIAPLGETRLVSRQVHGGTLSLLPWGDLDRVAEVEYIGPRRARETFYLEPQAPKGLRLIWESTESREDYLRQLDLDHAVRHTILELLDRSLNAVPPEALRTALMWVLATGPVNWSTLKSLEKAPLFDDAAGGKASVAELRFAGQPIATLSDRSCSLPRALTTWPLLWWDPLLEQLEIPTRDASREVREAHWQEAGRQKWLAAHQPKPPDWPANAQSCGPHLVARAPNPQSPTEVAFWREGRPFGRRVLPPAQCPSGYLVMWVEDELPGDTYWSGPSFEAVRERLPQIFALVETLEQRSSSHRDPPCGESR